ncbi:DUF4157 domain-containing protein [Chitinophaga sp. OAE865]|uniref:eCIS core domain-containing protein n=1 Tax=Chitinophaga sp. OAE865 TaxID=2817898 RepID=UPI001AE32931
MSKDHGSATPVPGSKAVAGNATGKGAALPAPQTTGVVQKKSNQTGLPDNLKTGVESLSGFSLDDVKVHYNSDKPFQMQAHAYAQGSDIHIAPGQERHLPHEAWHVVQQKQGRVPVTRQMKSIAVNDDHSLEQEADVMGMKALQTSQGAAPLQRVPVTGSVAQLARRTGLFGMEAEVTDGYFIIGAKKGSEGQNLIESEDITLEEFKLGEIDGKIDVTLDNEVKADNSEIAYRLYVIEFVQKAVDFKIDSPQELKKVAEAWVKAGEFWRASNKSTDLLKGKVQPDWYALNPLWKGGQFDSGDQQPYPGVSSKVEGMETKFEFDWRHHAFESYINVKKDDPEVSVQATAGSSLGALVENYMITHNVLTEGKLPEGSIWSGLDIEKQQRDEIEKPDSAALAGIFFILRTYVNASMGSEQKRYAKEYLGFMSRTSLDMAFAQLSPRMKEMFIKEVAAYIWGKPDGLLGRTIRKAPTDRVFTPDTRKEEQAHSITIEQMLLSMINKKKGDIEHSLAEGEAGATGDVFSENNLAGISEINPAAHEAIEKFKLHAASEMMSGETGLIFESRSAMKMSLSQMPEIFETLLTSFQKMDAAYHEMEAKVQEERKPKPQPQPRQPTGPQKKDENCIMM